MYDPTIGVWISEDPIGFEAADENLRRYVGNNPAVATDPSGLQEQKEKQGKIKNIHFITSEDQIPDPNPGVEFKNPAGARFDLNKPGPFVYGKDEENVVANVQWVVFYGENMEDVELTRYVTGTFKLDNIILEGARTGNVNPPLQGGKYPVRNEPKYIDTRGQGIAPHEICRRPGFIVVSDAPGTPPKGIKDGVNIEYTWHFYIEAKSKSTGQILGGIFYDVKIAGVFAEGKFHGLKDGPVNEATKGYTWPKK